jgi:hypothetical protein
MPAEMTLPADSINRRKYALLFSKPYGTLITFLTKKIVFRQETHEVAADSAARVFFLLCLRNLL